MEDIDDPDFLTEKEISQIEESLKDYYEGNYKKGSIDDLLDDLNNISNTKRKKRQIQTIIDLYFFMVIDPIGKFVYDSLDKV